MKMNGIQGISTYQMQVQSLSTRVNELSKESDANSLSIAATLKQQMNSVQNKLYEVQNSNKNALQGSYNSKAGIQNYSKSCNFDVCV